MRKKQEETDTAKEERIEEGNIRDRREIKRRKRWMYEKKRGGNLILNPT